MSLASNAINIVLNKLYSFISYVNLGDTINYYKKDYDDNSISITYSHNTPLYALCLEQSSNLEKKFDMRETDSGGKILVSILKHNGINKIYLFSDDKLTMLNIADKFEISLLSPDEIISALYSVFLVDCFKINDKKVENIYTNNGDESIFNYEPLHIVFPQMLKNATANLLRKYEPYQATIFSNRAEYSVFDLLCANWQGVIFYLLEFSKKEVSTFINNCTTSAKLMDSYFTKHYSEIKLAKNQEALNELYNGTVVINSIAFVRNDIDINKIENTTGVKYEPRYLSMDKIASKTLFRARDRELDFLVPRAWATQLISTTIQQDSYSQICHKGDIFHKVDFCGTDMQDGFFNYTFKQNLNPHALIFGTTGSGKSRSMLNILTQIMDFNFRTLRANSLNQNRKIRYCNVGYTGGRIFEAIEQQSKKDGSNLIQKMDSDIGKLRFSLFDFEADIPSEDELKAVTGFINLMLSFEYDKNNPNTTTLSNIETMIFRECVIKACNDKIENPSQISISELYLEPEIYADYKVFIDEILSSAKSKNEKIELAHNTLICDLPDKYKRFKRPILADIISILDSIKDDVAKTDGERSAIGTLKDKLSLFSQNKIFSTYSNVDLRDNTPLFYAEFETIKNDSKSFVAIAWLLITTWVKVDKQKALEKMNKNEPKPDSYYIIDEAHNFLKHEVFADLLEVYAREMRKFGCHLILLTQDPTDLPIKTASFFDTRCFIFSQNDKENTYNGLVSLNGGKELKPNAKKIYDKIENQQNKNRTIFMTHSGGASAFKLPEMNGYEHFFTSYNF